MSRRTKADARGANDVAFVEQTIEELPAVHATTDPDIGRVDATESRNADGLEGLLHELGVLARVGDVVHDLLTALRRIDSLGSTLNDVGSAVELGGLATVP